MTDQLPEPLTPHDCELQDFKFMPLDVARLRSSEQNSDVTPEANWAALMLWSASWHEVPAGSIPDNDQWIAKACGYVSLGTIHPKWEQVRDGAMRKFVRCSDGRLYHPTVAEKAREAWAAKLEQRWRTECGRIKKHNDRHELKGADAVAKPSYDEWIEAGRPQGQPLPVPRDKTGVSPQRPKGQPPGVPRETGSKGQGEGQGQGQGLEEPTVLPLPPGKPAGKGKAKPPKEVDPNRTSSAQKSCPEGFTVTPAMVQYAADKAPDVDWKRQTEKFRNHQFRQGYVDWSATWRNWMLEAQDRYEARHNGAAAGAAEAVRGQKPAETNYARAMRERTAEATGGILAQSPKVLGPLRLIEPEPTTPKDHDEPARISG